MRSRFRPNCPLRGRPCRCSRRAAARPGMTTGRPDRLSVLFLSVPDISTRFCMRLSNPRSSPRKRDPYHRPVLCVLLPKRLIHRIANRRRLGSPPFSRGPAVIGAVFALYLPHFLKRNAKSAQRCCPAGVRRRFCDARQSLSPPRNGLSQKKGPRPMAKSRSNPSVDLDATR